MISFSFHVVSLFASIFGAHCLLKCRKKRLALQVVFPPFSGHRFVIARSLPASLKKVAFVFDCEFKVNNRLFAI